MKKRTVLLAVIGAMAALTLVAPAAGATNSSATQSRKASARHPFFEAHSANLTRIPNDPAADGGSNAHGRVDFLRFGNKLLVFEVVNGLAADLPHAQHVHGIGLGVCPAANRRNSDGIITTVAGQPDYGMINVSLTTRGDASPASALAVDRFPAVNFFGYMVYSRVLTIGTDIPADVGYNIQNYSVVVHGIDVNHNGAYDFDLGKSLLDPALPLEATIPAACGQIN